MSNVTLKDIYEIVERLEDKMDIRLKDVEKRVDTLEDFKGKALGVMGVVSLVGSALFSWIWGRITKTVS